MRSAILSLLSVVFADNARAEEIKIAVVPTQLEESAKGMVPALFDDYLLTAVQNTSSAQVIGQDDIGAMLGFEKQKDMLNCDDTSCMADIGGALGVDKIVSVKVARLGEDWVATAKLINIKSTRVESRVNEIVGGDVKALLQAVPRLIGKLFGRTPIEVETRPSTAAAVIPTSPNRPPAGPAPAAGPNPTYGKTARVIGTILMLGGAAIGLAGGYKATNPAQSCYSDYYDGSQVCEADTDDVILGGFMIVAGIVSAGIGAKQRANGAARAALADPHAGASPRIYWLGWLLGGFAMATPFLGAADMMDEDSAEVAGWACGLGSLATFLIGGFTASSSSPAAYSALPLTPAFGLARASHDTLLPTFGLNAGF